MSAVIDVITLSDDEADGMDVDTTEQQLANGFDGIALLNSTVNQNAEEPAADQGKIKIEEIQSEVVVTTEKFVCDFCSFSCADEEQFINHKRQHSPLVYDCSLCSTRSRTAANRNLHERLAHKLERPCELENTSLKLTREQLAKVEEENGRFETPYKCDICNFGFSAQSVLNNHNQQKHQRQVYSCTKCPRTFSTITRRNNHEKLHHKIERQPDRRLKLAVNSQVLPKRKRGRPRKNPMNLEFRPPNVSSAIPARVIPTRSSMVRRTVKQEPFSATQPATLPENLHDMQPTIKPPTIDVKPNITRNFVSQRPPISVTASFSKPQELNPTLMMKKLTSKPSLIYYDYHMLNKQYGLLPISTWCEHSKCEILLLRLDDEGSQRELGIGLPIWKCLMPRFELAPSMNRESYLMCFVKKSSEHVFQRGKDALNDYMNFVNVVCELLPSLQMESSLIIASNCDRQSIQHLNLQSQQIYVP
ncbi:hypothetical protein M3Y94_01034600 [Aphelenchoides besseyi]|nr:hypothetical protein M3Y94_01034600 [Aphelenchoides besseyi]KAI6223942.1 hypothetical protein M3Y95_00830200 [Aphelenchoides besseyi]